MLFSSPEFLFAFLPLFLLSYFLVPARARNLLLFIASLFFYFTTSGELTLILALSVVVNYWIALRLVAVGGKTKRMWFVLGVVANVAPLLYYKYTGFFVSAANDASKAMGHPFSWTLPEIILPIGISFFTFQAVSYIADVAMNRVPPAKNLIDFGMYHSCFPQLIAGPIVRYEEIESQVRARTLSWDDTYAGALRFCFGLAKKMILADPMGRVADAFFGAPISEVGMTGAWVGALAYSLQIYFDFSGYSDMAIGIGRILGFKYPENFNQPYRSRSITEFWHRWHMTLSRWFRDYIYIPMGGNREGWWHTYFNLFVVFFLCGLWHGAAYTFVAWGIYHGVLLVIERMVGKLHLPSPPALIGSGYAVIAAMVGWVLFRADTLPQALVYLHTMVSFTSGSAALFDTALTTDRMTYMVAAVIVALFPFERFNALRGTKAFLPSVSIVALLIFFTSFSMMAGNGFHPFIYFRF